MIINNKRLSTPNSIEKKFTFSSFLNKADTTLDSEVISPIDKSLCINFDNGSGALTSGVGLEIFTKSDVDVSLPDGVRAKKLYFYKNYHDLTNTKDDRVIVLGSDNYLYSLTLFTTAKFKKIDGFTFSDIPTAINYNYNNEDVLIISSTKDGLFILKDLTLKKVNDAPLITSMCIHSERLFVTTKGEGTTLWFSDDFNVENWVVSLDEAGYIELPDERGKMLKVISFLDYVYVFREYGISRIIAYGRQEDFSVDNLFNNVGKIYADTVTECGKYIIFLSSTGIYRFNGIDFVKILPLYDEYLLGVDNVGAKGVFYNNKFYISLKMKLDGKTIEKVILVYDTENKSSYVVRGLKIDDLEVIKNNSYYILALSNGILCKLNNSGKRFNKTLNKSWKTFKNDFNLMTSNKVLKKVMVETNEPITLNITCDDKTFSYNLDAYNSSSKTLIKGKDFSFEIVSKTLEPKVTKLVAVFSYCKESLW